MNSSDTPPLILVINAGSTSREYALFMGSRCMAEEEFITDLPPAGGLPPGPGGETVEAVAEAGRRFLAEQGYRVSDLSALVARGGILRPIPGGVYAINETMVRDCLEHRYGRHASNLAAPAARQLAGEEDVMTIIVNPPTVDELSEEARTTGLPQIRRRSIFHALNQKAVAAEVAAKLGKTYAEARLIVVHMGGGLSIGAHLNGRVVDVNDALEGDGPFSMNRTGGLPALPLLKWAKDKSIEEVTHTVCKTGGFMAHLSTDDARQVEQRVRESDPEATAVFEAFTYHVAKAAVALTIPLAGKVDAIALTGGLARWGQLVERLRERLAWLAPMHVYPGSRELEAMAAAALAVLNGEQTAQEY